MEIRNHFTLRQHMRRFHRMMVRKQYIACNWDLTSLMAIGFLVGVLIGMGLMKLGGV